MVGECGTHVGFGTLDAPVLGYVALVYPDEAVPSTSPCRVVCHSPNRIRRRAQLFLLSYYDT
jgi:hypothetical protein